MEITKRTVQKLGYELTNDSSETCSKYYFTNRSEIQNFTRIFVMGVEDKKGKNSELSPEKYLR